MLSKFFNKQLLKIISISQKIHLNRLLKRGLKIGKNCNFLSGVMLDSSRCWHIEIGDNVTLAPHVHILAHGASMKRHLGYAKIGKVKIGNNVFIGAGTIDLPNVTIGENSIIGAGNVVTKDVPSNVVVAGNPVKILYDLESFLLKHNNLMSKKPVFGDEYTLRKNVTSNMKHEINTKMEEGDGYIV